MEQNMGRPELILGTMTFGRQVDERAAEDILDQFLAAGYQEIDTAYDYGKGATEEILGRILTPTRRQKVSLATKANPWGEGGLRPESVRSQLETSLRRLQTESVDLFYLHAPDLKTPIEVTLKVCQELFREGKFRQLGLSNYAAWQVVDIWHICKRYGWVLPTVYQGMYNGITRAVEAELFPALRSLGIRFYAYNPLAGGLLTGKHLAQEQVPTEGRFALLPMYQERYWKKRYFDAIEQIRCLCEKRGMAMAESALRWELYHSMLSKSDRDALIVGASNLEQLSTNLRSIKRGPLYEDVLAAYDNAWKMVLPDCPPYYRS